MSEERPEIIGLHDSHEAIRRALAARPPGRVLDAATGEGVLAKFLLDRGWDVHCADICPEFFKLPDVECQKVNLNRPLDFEDDSFDAVLLVNVIHRLFNPGGAIREAFRVLKPGGHLYLNANNYATMDLRLRFLLYGSIEHRDPMEGVGAEDPESVVRIQLMYPRIADAMETAGFRIVELTPVALRPKHRVLAPLSWLIRLLTRLIPASRRKRDHIDQTASKAILSGGYYVLIDAEKPEG
jgi:SAM-dependent methyltransferase